MPVFNGDKVCFLLFINWGNDKLRETMNLKEESLN